VDWLRDGDRNTGFFQAKAKARAKTNKISCLKKEAGELIRDQDRLESMASQFYQGLFTGQEELDLELVCSYVPRKVSGPMNEMLDRQFTVQEVERALFQMSPNKAPRPDGFTAGFFQKHWTLVKDSVTNAVLGFLNGGDMSEVVNQTVLVLIPKVANP
jgi:hypothetical protein